MYAELLININTPLGGTFHYSVPADMEARLRVGHLVEVEFGRRLAQAVIIAFDERSPVEDVKPIIGLIDEEPVVLPTQIELARWMSAAYLTPINACLRLFFPPGLSAYSDITVEINPYWDGNGRLTPLQTEIIALLRKEGDMRGRAIGRALPKTEWKKAVNQLARRKILLKASLLDPPRARPKRVRSAQLIASPERWRTAVSQFGRNNKAANILSAMLASDDPLPTKTAVLAASNSDEKALRRLLKEGLVREENLGTQIAQMNADKEEKSASISVHPSTTLILAQSPDETVQHIVRLRGAGKVDGIVRRLIEAGTAVSTKELYAETGATITHLRKLVKADIIRLTSEEVWRDPLADRDFVPADAPMLTADQARIWGRVKMMQLESAGEHPIAPVLLHGVTGSGKTEIYMRAIAHALENGQQAIVLVPEIALTPQTVRRFASRFPGQVTVMHSRLTDGERYDTWRRARAGKIGIIVGARSSLFVPLPNVGVIVLDEEHDDSYKQTPPVPPPYYHARETAVAYARLNNALLLLGSATPDINSYHRARAGRYQLLELPKRVMGHRLRIENQAARMQVESFYRREDADPDDALSIPLPPVSVVDLRQELRAGNRSIFSRVLETAVDETLERGEQAILFLNRRGTATFVICRDCGYVAKCPRCDMPLTYHRPGMMLSCHHCGRHEPPSARCPECGSKRIKHFGMGTEKVEMLVKQKWPQARVVRWDRDTTAGRDSHEALLAQFINNEADILVGTQMIAKGLDLPLVTLVGVISADTLLGLPDFRMGERAFQLLTQVAGRAGRGLRGGQVIIQTYKPEHYAIQAAAEHDFVRFYLDEIRFRTQQQLPPFRRLARLLRIDPYNDRARGEAQQVAKGLRRHAREMGLSATEIVGPTPPFFGKVNGRFRWQIIIRSPDPARLLADFTLPARWMVDIDPVSTL